MTTPGARAIPPRASTPRARSSARARASGARAETRLRVDASSASRATPRTDGAKMREDASPRREHHAEDVGSPDGDAYERMLDASMRDGDSFFAPLGRALTSVLASASGGGGETARARAADDARAGDAAIDPEDLDVDADVGLSEREARRRYARWGANETTGCGVDEDARGGTGASTAGADGARRAIRREMRDPMTRAVLGAIVLELTRSMNARVTSTDDPFLNALILAALVAGNAYAARAERADAVKASYELTRMLEAKATVIRDGAARVVDARSLVPGDVVALGPGVAVPADCVSAGPHALFVDNTAVTGERRTTEVLSGEPLFMRAVVKRGNARALVVRTGRNTFAGRAAALVRERESHRRERSAFDESIEVITRFSVVSGVACSLAVFFYLIVDGRDFFRSLAFCVILLVSSTPLAIRTVTAMTTSLGVRSLAKKSAIVTRMSVIEDLASMNVVCVDKTGALTRDATRLHPRFPTVPLLEGVSENDVITAAALATRWSEPPTSAVDAMIIDSYDVSRLAQYELVKHSPFDAGNNHQYSESSIARHDGTTFRVIKGPVEEVLKLCANGDTVREIVDSAMVRAQSMSARGVIARALVAAMSQSREDAFVALGLIVYEDVRRKDASEMIHVFNSLGVEVKIVTGDDARTCAAACDRLKFDYGVEGIKTPSDVPYVPLRNSVLSPSQCDALDRVRACAGMLAEDKRALVGALRARGDVVGFVSDAASDAAAIGLAHVGVVTQSSTDAAKNASDIVLAAPSLAVLAHAVLAARIMFARVRDYVIFRATCTAHVLGFFVLGALFVSPKRFDESWPDTFTLPVIALCVVLALNDLVVIGVAYDHASPSRLPERWRVAPDVMVAISGGLTACASSLALLVISLNAFAGQGGTAMDISAYGRAQTCAFLKIALTDAMTVFSARTHGTFLERRPGGMLLTAFFISTMVACMLAANWPFNALQSTSWGVVAFVVAFAVGGFLLQDFAKTTTRRVLLRAGWLENVGVVSGGEIDRVARACDRAARRARENVAESVAEMKSAPSLVSDERAEARRPLLDEEMGVAEEEEEEELDEATAEFESGGVESELSDDDDDFYSDYGSEAQTSSAMTNIERAPEFIAEIIHLEEDTPKFEKLRRTPGYCATTLSDVRSLMSSHDWWSTFAALQRERIREKIGGDEEYDDGETIVSGVDEYAPSLEGDESDKFDDDSSSNFTTRRRRAGVLPSDALRALEVQCGVGTFSAALCRELREMTDVKMRSRLADPAMRRLCVSVDFLDISAAALSLAATSLETPFRVGTLHRGGACAFFPVGGRRYDVVYSAFGLSTVPRGKIHAALRNFRAALRPGGLGFIAAFTEQSHDARFHAMYHAERTKTIARRSENDGAPRPPTFAEQICDALSAAGASYNVEVSSHVTEVDASIPGALEAYLHGVAMDDALSLETMMASSALGAYLSSCVAGDGTMYAFPQRVAHITL